MMYPVSHLPQFVRMRLSAAMSQVPVTSFILRDLLAPVKELLNVNKVRLAARASDLGDLSHYPRAAVSSEHHTHFSREDMIALINCHPERKRIILSVEKRLRTIDGVSRAFAMTLYLYLLTAPLPVAIMLACSSVFDANNYDEVYEQLKAASVIIKALHNPIMLNLTAMFELQTLVNRGGAKVNWQLEREHRINPDVVIADQKQVYESARKIFCSGISMGYKYRTMTAGDFAATRWEWSTSGSVHSQYPEDDPFIVREDYRHRSKFATLNQMSSRHVQSLFSRQPQTHAWGSEKIEWGKQRAIYGVDLTSSLISHFAMFNCEDVLKHRFPVGRDAEATRVHHRLKAMLQGADSYCYDFDDFNAQHSTDSMVSVLQAFFDTFKSDMTDDQVQAMDWVIKSMFDVTIHPPSGDTYRPNGTLLSGSRMTTFINTVLNFVYFDISHALETHGVVDSVHNGDDVLFSITHMKAAVDIHHSMAGINARAQATKCNLFSVGEFLRVEHKVDRTDAHGSQYLARACATFTHSRIESQAPVRLLSALNAARSRVDELSDRTTLEPELLDHLTLMVVSKAAKIFKTPVEEALLIFDTHVVAGGVSTHPAAAIETAITEEFTKEETTSYDDSSALTTGQLLPGITDYAKFLFKKMDGLVDYQQIFSAVTRATRKQLEITRDVKLTLVNNPADHKYAYARALFRHYKGIFDLPYLARARFLSIPPLALATQAQMKVLLRLTSDVSDVAWCLKVLL
ncbi:putative RNA-dependent RNA polymerase [Cronartium ribicola totivirus 5]|uniref:RNA-directed RNA polymerase n=1 Tax=Cronartium ribicola totivirus 5 TaxID=2687251 RepID=A0A6B9EU06_9VIRU|nr:putative RNA-dependent RNA polymerase [Cronartium ribicola totivirus 5]